MDDLERLNRRIACHWLGNLDAAQLTYLAFASICVGQLAHSASELAERLAELKRRQLDAKNIAKLNRRYLRFARLATRDAAAGSLHMLVRLGITFEQAEVIRNLSDEDLDRLAFGLDAPIIRFFEHAFDRGTALHRQAGKHHATAFVAARLAPRSGERA